MLLSKIPAGENVTSVFKLTACYTLQKRPTVELLSGSKTIVVGCSAQFCARDLPGERFLQLCGRTDNGKVLCVRRRADTVPRSSKVNADQIAQLHPSLACVTGRRINILLF